MSRLQLLREGIVNGEPEGLLQELTLGGELLLIAARVARRLVEVGIKQHNQTDNLLSLWWNLYGWHLTIIIPVYLRPLDTRWMSCPPPSKRTLPTSCWPWSSSTGPFGSADTFRAASRYVYKFRRHVAYHGCNLRTIIGLHVVSCWLQNCKHLRILNIDISL